MIHHCFVYISNWTILKIWRKDGTPNVEKKMEEKRVKRLERSMSKTEVDSGWIKFEMQPIKTYLQVEKLDDEERPLLIKNCRSTLDEGKSK